MSGQNGTGPFGRGSRTGKKMGICTATRTGNVTGDEKACKGRRLGRCGNGRMTMVPDVERLPKPSIAEQKKFCRRRFGQPWRSRENDEQQVTSCTGSPPTGR